MNQRWHSETLQHLWLSLKSEEDSAFPYPKERSSIPPSPPAKHNDVLMAQFIHCNLYNILIHLFYLRDVCMCTYGGPRTIFSFPTMCISENKLSLSRPSGTCLLCCSDFNVFLSDTSPLQSSLEVGLLPQKYLPLQFRFCFLKLQNKSHSLTGVHINSFTLMIGTWRRPHT